MILLDFYLFDKYSLPPDYLHQHHWIQFDQRTGGIVTMRQRQSQCVIWKYIYGKCCQVKLAEVPSIQIIFHWKSKRIIVLLTPEVFYCFGMGLALLFCCSDSSSEEALEKSCSARLRCDDHRQRRRQQVDSTVDCTVPIMQWLVNLPFYYHTMIFVIQNAAGMSLLVHDILIGFHRIYIYEFLA